MLKKLRQLGPGMIVAAAFIGPGTVTTASMAGAGYGYTLLWAMLFSILATIILQEMTARLGTQAKMGLGQAIRYKSTNKFLKYLSFGLVISAIVIGNAAYESGNLAGAVMGFEDFPPIFGINSLLLLIGITAFILLFLGKYKYIERFLILLVSIMGVVFILAAVLLHPSIIEILKGLFIPVIPEKAGLMVMGLIGTTVVPYNLFLHASATKTKWKNGDSLNLSRLDTILSVSLGGLITMAIMITSAVAFQDSPQEIDGIEALGEQLKPILGDWSTYFIAFGFLAAGFSSSITAPLAAAFATSEILDWKDGLSNKKFKMVWAFVLLTGIIIASLGIRPTSLILFAQVANGLLLPILAIYLIWIVNDKALMGKHVNTKLINVIGVVVIVVTFLLGLKSIISAFEII
ncbi:manganese transporter [Marivirga tractuosa]|uniref:Natural resistance-associated macrophage protein n=1 Tax=Marivirga tractuosa (strain ATCC 23168 / DSM 4126 / NBRC 15989 / NCIMB 1408 / VKM B-1430 / H-43) TaxID=643867 RepID=E4TP80_MARTH|nr:Nramp family divalent metal transporter [Marivirga tractuosa]ADR20483.1 natural resistance-associated macrophage protein [Marivirga tractuosa DSM 4126]BDD15071.1 manganese transporter [Marivirga tractuosa]